MNYINISNLKTEGLTPLDFYRNPSYKRFGVSSGSSTLVPFYKELLKEVIGEQVNTVFMDRALSKSETEQIKIVFEREMDRLISTRIPTGKPPHKGITYKGVLFELDLRLTSPIDRRMEDVFTILEISKECLDQNKPMYLSIE
jgi:hypothetical protein